MFDSQVASHPTTNASNKKTRFQGNCSHLSDVEFRDSTAYTVGLIQYKPVRGSGWLDKVYSKSKNTKFEVIEYPRVEVQREPDNVKHWYWNYRWYECSSKDGKLHVQSIYIPQKLVLTVRSAIANRISHCQIQKILKGV